MNIPATNRMHIFAGIPEIKIKKSFILFAFGFRNSKFIHYVPICFDN